MWCDAGWMNSEQKFSHYDFWRFVGARSRLLYSLSHAHTHTNRHHFFFSLLVLFSPSVRTHVRTIETGSIWFLRRRMNRRAVKVQAGARQMRRRIEYRQLHARRFWAAATIQKMYRGLLGRRRVATIVEEVYDTGLRRFALCWR